MKITKKTLFLDVGASILLSGTLLFFHSTKDSIQELENMLNFFRINNTIDTNSFCGNEDYLSERKNYSFKREPRLVENQIR